ncbi:MAG: P-loop NTPase, partial [Planctomycetes bacterium]|nr:P-loop NTPase [Planctomycetota bacterium]
MILSVASGKGGTGKTTVAVNLAWCAPESVLLLDCDVEEPNCHLFLRPEVRSRETVTIPVPVLDPSKCDSCGQRARPASIAPFGGRCIPPGGVAPRRGPAPQVDSSSLLAGSGASAPSLDDALDAGRALCSQICEFNAVVFLGDRPLVFPALCHGCGGCIRVCAPKALTEVGSPIGVVEVGDAGRVTLVTGRLDVGRALSPPLIHAVRRHADPARLTIVDSPPGTACPLVAAAAGADYALLVAEPSRFGIHDLGLVVSSLREIGVPLGVVVNRSRGEDGDLGAFCERE